ncbi:ERBB receptor feedback inhibitor 1a [Pseudoliparis swirei]|uniref:ERBB receptor feedback inhibitor 1a n=1 Tax=Pseudoliparis swirei TaxID=2059687 RepID=UPI0024BD98B2|nr:ERBB receptor feedback inhibitor 1a [Pseudoliparis swirei]XP_056294284.1 ERBB receptor feedback inhibitor 1a [Pseudoliparis swirei]
MRPECAWSMSTVGLAAQEIYFPIENPFLRGSYCQSMAGSKPSWNYHNELDNFYFSMDTAHSDNSSRAHHKGPPPPCLNYERQKHSPSSQRLPPKKSRPSHLSLSCSVEPSTPSPADDDQVVPSFQRLSVYECSSPPQTPGRCSKPLPPIPPQTDVSTEQAMDKEVEFFTSSDDSCCLVSDQSSKSSPFRYGVPNRRSFRDCGQINYAYYDVPLGPQSQKQPKQQQQHHQAHPPQEVREQHEPQRQEPPEPAVYQRQQDKAQRRLRRSHSGPAGSFNKPSLLRLTCQKRHTQSMDKPEIPPPIPPRTIKTGDYRRWSAEVSSGAYSDEDKPPKVPPREPLSRGSSRTPSPKSLPTYINGVMPPTQSFAPDPKYVSCRGLQRQQSEGSPCILPDLENGKKASTTHYYLLPQRPAFLDSPYVERFLRVMESPAARNTDVSDLDWDCHTKRKAHVDLV